MSRDASAAALELVRANDLARHGVTALSAQPFAVRAFSDMMVDPELSKPIHWVVDRLVAVGTLNVVYGAGKIGKSTLLAYMMICVALGLPFAGLTTRRGRVLWIDLEQGPRRLRRSLGAVPGASAAGLPLDVYSDLTDRGRSVTALAATLAAGDYAVAVIDSCGKLAQIEDENDNAAWQQALQPLEELARSGNTAIILIDHDRKSEGEHGRGLRGAGSKLAAMDTAIHVKRAKAATGRVLSIVSRESGTFDLDLVLGSEGYTQGARSVDVIESTLRSQGAMSLNALLNHLSNAGMETKRTTARDRLEKLQAAGLVVSTGAGTRGDPQMYAIAGDVAECDAATNRQNDAEDDE